MLELISPPGLGKGSLTPLLVKRARRGSPYCGSYERLGHEFAVERLKMRVEPFVESLGQEASFGAGGRVHRLGSIEGPYNSPALVFSDDSMSSHRSSKARTDEVVGNG